MRAGIIAAMRQLPAPGGGGDPTWLGAIGSPGSSGLTRQVDLPGASGAAALVGIAGREGPATISNLTVNGVAATQLVRGTYYNGPMAVLFTADTATDDGITVEFTASHDALFAVGAWGLPAPVPSGAATSTSPNVPAGTGPVFVVATPQDWGTAGMPFTTFPQDGMVQPGVFGHAIGAGEPMSTAHTPSSAGTRAALIL